MTPVRRPAAPGSAGGRDFDDLVIGAGFYGCALAAWLARSGRSVLVCEAGSQAMQRASAVNQARVHTGFHYPRSYVTALRSLGNYERFAEDFAPAVVRDVRMLYAIARYGTKVDARRFFGMYQAMRAPIERAGPAQRALFDPDLVADVFSCEEHAFDHAKLRGIMLERLAALPVSVRYARPVARIEPAADKSLWAHFETGEPVRAERVFNVAYAQLNQVLRNSGLPLLPLKHELVEIALVEPPAALGALAVTVMDGAFFSTMPWPAAQAYSLTHVRYTPHFGWTDQDQPAGADAVARRLPNVSRWRHMVNDARRYLPCLAHAKWIRSLFDVKTVPIKNEGDDGRPILLHAHSDCPGLWSVLGSKLDNIYDLYEAIG